MVNRVQSLRSSVAGQRPTGRTPGELYSNWPDKQFGVIDSTSAAMDLIGVRFFSTTANYATGDHVIQAGALYKATGAVTAGAFNPAQWTPIGGSITVGDSPPSNPQQGSLWFDSVGGNLYCFFVDASGPPGQWVVANNIIGAYLPVGGGTLTGPLTLAADPAQPMQAATKEYVDASAPTNVAGGFLNRLRNGTFDVWQRGTGTFSCLANQSTYTADGWVVGPQGAAVSALQGGGRNNVSNGGAPTSFSLGVLGAVGVTALAVQQFVESYVAAPLAGQRCTFQLQIYNGTGATITPQLAVYTPTARDNYTSINTILSPTNLQACPNAVWTRLAYTFDMPQSAGFGALPQLTFGSVLNTGAKQINITEADLRVTPGLPVGLCANPPPPELRPIHEELMFCQRYYESGGFGVFSGNITTGLIYYSGMSFKASKRVNPTCTFISGGTPSGFPNVAPTLWTATAQMVGAQMTANASGTGIYWWTFTASAEL